MIRPKARKTIAWWPCVLEQTVRDGPPTCPLSFFPILNLYFRSSLESYRWPTHVKRGGREGGDSSGYANDGGRGDIDMETFIPDKGDVEDEGEYVEGKGGADTPGLEVAHLGQ